MSNNLQVATNLENDDLLEQELEQKLEGEREYLQQIMQEQDENRETEKRHFDLGMPAILKAIAGKKKAKEIMKEFLALRDYCEEGFTDDSFITDYADKRATKIILKKHGL